MVKIAEFDLAKRTAIVAVIDKDIAKQAKEAHALGADILELRLDLLYIQNFENIVRSLNHLKSKVNFPCIATNRLQTDGGKYNGSEKNRIQLLIDMIPLVDAIDIELHAPHDLQQKLISKAHHFGKTVIVSQHDFNRTPSIEEMQEIIKQAWARGADIAKFAAQANSLADTLNLLTVTHSASKPVCMIAMGDLGRHTRIIAPFYGSVLSYGSIDSAVAPGQLKVDALKQMMEALL